jgi:hypothetical protein
VEDMMMKMRGLQIASLGEGYFMQTHYFPDKSFYFHNEEESIDKSSTENRRDAPEKPSIDELGKSKSIRSHPKGLCKASGFKAMSNFLLEVKG